MLYIIILATALVSAISLIGILFFWQKKYAETFIKTGIGLAAGALLGAVFLNIIPELFGHEVHGGAAMGANTKSFIILISIIFFFLLEKYLHWHHCQYKHEKNHIEKKPLGYINLVGDGLHNFIDGSLIASTFLIDMNLGIVTTVAIMTHEIPQEIADFTILIHAGFKKNQALLWNLIFALTAVLGGIATYFFANSVTNITPVLLSLAVGSFLYLSMSDIIPELHQENNTKQIFKQLAWLMIGIALIYFSNQLVGGNFH